ncbi:MAG: DUF3737 family protein [Clostridia bacterium]|nr:DUF3737 family protein [Clostridia bacterium]
MKLHERKTLEGLTLDEERALYNLNDAVVKNCVFAGPADGESALKECRNVAVEGCSFSLRYPVWHAKDFTVSNCDMDEKTRAALWYCKSGVIDGCTLGGIKALRECSEIVVNGCKIVSPEFGWRCRNIILDDCDAVSEYFMFESKNLTLKNVKFNGKYSFQYVKDALIEDCDFSTKDAFWHSKNITVKNSVLRGEYLGWYSEGLTLINCLITGTQPLCYCKKLTLINCRTEGCDLSFEYSDVKADISGEVLSVKNPKKGRIVADGYGEIIFDSSLYPCKGKVLKR